MQCHIFMGGVKCQKWEALPFPTGRWPFICKILNVLTQRLVRNGGRRSNPCSLVSSEKCHVKFGCGGGAGDLTCSFVAQAPNLRSSLFLSSFPPSSQASWAPTVKSTMMNVSTDTAPIIPRVLTWLQTMSAFVLRALLVNYLCHHFHSLGLNENSAD